MNLTFNKYTKKLYLVLLVVIAIMAYTNVLKASSHREAPLISSDPLADNVDVYAFRSPDNPNTVTLIATYVPMQLPQGGPNYYSFGKNIRYEIHVDNDAAISGDEVTYRFTFDVINEDPTTFFNIRLGKQNQKTMYTLERSLDGGKTFTTIITKGIVPPNNIGPRSITGGAGLNTTYNTLFQNGIASSSTGEKVFVGPTDDPFFVDLGGIFDLGDSPRQGGKAVDGLACMNVSAIAIQVPISTLLKKGAATTPKNILDGDYVIGVWASASRRSITTLSAKSDPVASGSWVQVSRLGMPLTNEAVIPVGAKDFWNSITPYDEITETTLDKYFFNPELALYMDDSLFGGAVPAFGPLRIQQKSLGAFDFTNGADGLFGLKGNPALAGTALDDAVFGKLLLPGKGMPRSVDLWPAFHTGVPNVIPYQLATGKNGNPLAAGKPFVNNFLPNGGDMLRLNMAVPVTPRNDPNFSSLGLVQAAAIGLTVAPFNTSATLEFIPNMDGFPNGRRLEDDVTRIELQAVAGVVLAAVGLWYDDYNPATSTSPVTKQLLNVLTYTTGVEKNDKPFTASFPYLAQPHSGTGDCSGEIVRTDFITNPAYQVFVSSNNSGKVGVYNFGADTSFSVRTFDAVSTDADGIYYDKATDVIYQLNRTKNVINAFSKISENLQSNLSPVLTATSTSDFTNGREIAVRGNKLVVAQDADPSNGSVDKFIIYTITPTSIVLDKKLDVKVPLWGIHLDGNTLYAVEDVSERVLRFDNFFDLPAGPITPNHIVAIKSMVRTHGITYDREGDVMILTDVASAASDADGAFTVIRNYNTKAADSVITEAEQIIIEGPKSLLGNPVDIAFDRTANRIYIAERAKNGGRVLGFTMPTISGDAEPIFNQVFAGASAIHLSNLRKINVTQPTVSIFDPKFGPNILITARLNGASSVPTVTTEGIGVGTITFNSDYTQATLNLSISNLSSDVTDVHIHTGRAGVNGPVKFDFTKQFKQGRITNTFPVTQSDVAGLIDGEFYLNVHTKNNIAGEIRGQLGVEAGESFKAELSGANEIPSVRTEAAGIASVIYTANTNVLEINLLAANLSGPIKGIHIHNGASNASGPVVQNLEAQLVGNTIIAKIQAGNYIAQLRAGNLYFNIHTEAYPGGEIRGQITKVNGLHFDAWMTGSQEVPATVNSTIGLVMGSVTSTLDKMNYRMLVDNPTNRITGFHIHQGKLGANGGVVVDLGSNLKGQMASNDSVRITKSLLESFLSGNLYFNAHTPTFPGGEVRGQVYRVARDGYAYDLCQAQETTPVVNAGNASGSGMFAFNRDYDEAHLMAVASELSSAFRGAHIHNGKTGVAGPIVFDFTDKWTKNGAFFYFTDASITNLANLVQGANAYVNVHTANNPSGEIRGQITRTAECPFVTSIVEIGNQTFEIQVFPNPVYNQVSIQFNGDSQLYQDSKLQIRDLTGRILHTTNITSDRTSIDISSFQAGIYLIQTSNEAYSNSIKIVKI